MGVSFEQINMYFWLIFALPATVILLILGFAMSGKKNPSYEDTQDPPEA